jgi:hypothetical protein
MRRYQLRIEHHALLVLGAHPAAPSTSRTVVLDTFKSRAMARMLAISGCRLRMAPGRCADGPPRTAAEGDG